MSEIVLWVTQFQDDTDNDIEIVKFATVETWERIGRVFPNRHNDEAVNIGDVWIQLMAADETLTDERITVSSSQAEWFLGEFYHMPRKRYKKLKAAD